VTRLSSAPVRLLTTVVFAGLAIGAISPGAAVAEKAAVHVAPAGVSAALGPLINIPQTWNNCGPASVAEVLAYYGISRSQDQVRAVLRGDGNPYGMAPYGVPAYMRSLGMRALLGIDGSERLLKELIANGFPVIVSQWVSLADHVGHYRPLQAYDDAQGLFVSSDPYLGQGHTIAYGEFDAIWQTTNRRFMVLYPPRREALLQAVLRAAGWDYVRAYRQDLAHQEAPAGRPTAPATAATGTITWRSPGTTCSSSRSQPRARRCAGPPWPGPIR
jgi:hypothetical protein